MAVPAQSHVGSCAKDAASCASYCCDYRHKTATMPENATRTRQNATSSEFFATGAVACYRFQEPPQGDRPVTMTFVVSKSSDWDVDSYVKVPFSLVCCEHLTSSSKLILIALYNQVGFRPVNYGTLDRLLGIHRSTRIRCFAELRELQFLNGDDNHLVMNDPVPVLKKLIKNGQKDQIQAQEVLSYEDYAKQALSLEEDAPKAVKRDYLQEATDAWNRYRPRDYKAVNRISAQIIKAIDIHMRDLRVPPHRYEEFFSILKAGIEKSDFWSNQNSAKTLQSVTGVGTPTDKKKGNVYALFNDGVQQPATATEEGERSDSTVFPAKYRKLIDEYESAQTVYNEAYRGRSLTEDHRGYIVRTEQDLSNAGLDPARFRFKFGIRDWPTTVPEPVESRVVNWSFDDEYGNVY